MFALIVGCVASPLRDLVAPTHTTGVQPMMTDAQYVKHCCKMFRLELLRYCKGDGYAVFDLSTGEEVIVAEALTYKELREQINKWGLNR